jgi:ATP-binding cassette subfamily C protein CydC
MKTFLRLIRLSSPYKYWMLLAALTGFLTIGSSIGLLMTSAYIISKAALHPSISELQAAIVGVRFFGISRGIFRYAERLLSHNTTFRLLTRFRVWFFEALEPLAPARLLFHKGGDILSRAINDIKTLENFYVRVMGPPLTAIMVSLLMWFLVGTFSFSLSLILLFFYLTAAFAVPLISYLYAKGTGKKIISLRSRIKVMTMDAIQGIAELQLFGEFENHKRELLRLERKYQRLLSRMAGISALHESLIGLLMNGAVLTVLVIAIPMVSSGSLNGVYLAVLGLGVMASFEAFLPLPEAVQMMEANIRAGERLFEIIDCPPEIINPSNPLPLPDNRAISTDNLSFSYPGTREPALKNLSLDIESGSKVAIVGPSGSGKSTFINLLMRFWEYSSGNILIGGNELRDMAEEDIRRMFAVVAYNSALFNGTIKENLLIGNTGASEDELIEACRKAELLEFIGSQPEGFNTWIGEQGLKLSGGERQRLTIARAYLRGSPILILDEITANLDAITEEAVLQNLFEFSRDKTVINITHRLKHMEKMDLIYVLYKGEIIERGKHHELLSRDSFYRKMYEIQRQSVLVDEILG